MKDHEQAHNPASKQLESEGKNFLSPPAFSLNASPVDPPSDGSEGAAQFKKGDSNGAGGDASAGSGLPSDVRSQMEGSLGANFSGVKINANSSKATEMGALAFTQGEELHFAPGQFQPGSQQGQELIGHELAHVVQQREGRVKATGQEKGLAINTDHSLESEADSMGAKAAAQLKAAESSSASVGSYTGGSGILQKAEDPTKPQLEAYKGVMVSQMGRISAPASQYAIAKSTGVNVRSKPNSNLPAIGKLLYNSLVQVVAEDNCGGYYFVIGAGTMGWVVKSYVAIGMPDPTADLHHITEPNLTTILQRHYVDGGRWPISTGNDYTTLAAGVIAANAGRLGVTVNWAKAEEYKDNNSLKAWADPWMIDNKAIYNGSQVIAGTNIWLPPASYIEMLQASGKIGSRPELLNEAISLGQGIAGFTIGVQAGIYGNLWDMLSGLVDAGRMIVDTIKSVLDGSLFTNIAEIYNSLVNIDGPQAMKLAEGILSSALGAAKDFIKSWDSDDMYNCWFFRGKIAGMIITEVILAIVTAGSSLGAKLTSKLLDAFPKLGKVAAKILKAADKLDFNKKKKSNGGGFGADDADGADLPDTNNFDNVDPSDKKQMQILQALALATAITNANDLLDTPVPILLKQLQATVGAKYPAVNGYEANPVPGKAGTYDIVQFAKKDVKKNYTDGKETEEQKKQDEKAKEAEKRKDWKRWELTDEAASRTATHTKYGKFYKSKSDGLWWSTDIDKHGGSQFKVFEESPKGLEWIADADEYGTFIEGKHKGKSGASIEWGKLKITK
jgi:hypothetical protein